MPSPAPDAPDQDPAPDGTTKKSLWRRKWMIALLSVSALLVAALATALIWASSSYPANAERLEKVQSDAHLAYEDLGDAIRIKPSDDPTGQGLIFFPGAKVEPQAYASLLAEAADHGVTVIIVKPPLNIALLQLGNLDSFMALAPEVDTWAVGGHSMGGVKACQFADDPQVSSLLLFASYCASSEVSDHPGLDVLALYGDRDEVINRQEVENFELQFSENASSATLNGVTHAQFGDYGLQPGDGTALVSISEAHQLISGRFLPFLLDR